MPVALPLEVVGRDLLLDELPEGLAEQLVLVVEDRAAHRRHPAARDGAEAGAEAGVAPA